MNEARAEVSHYARGLQNPAARAETAMVRTEQHGQILIDPDQEAL